jgi:nicotinate-nucleotide adenylyltransferase
MKKRKIGLFFGSFNPIHVGHLIIANHILEFTDLERIWFIVSPCNPLKNKDSLLDEKQRLYMVKLAIDSNPNFKASDVEFKLSVPSYTIKTLAYLTDEYPKYDFSLIMGSDNLQNFKKWKNYETILELYSIYVYPRPDTDIEEWLDCSNIHLVDNVPVMEMSASHIRKMIKEKKSIQYLVPEKVRKYIDDMLFYIR